MAARRKGKPSPKGKRPKAPTAYQKRLASVARRIGKSFGRGPVGVATARRVERRRRGFVKSHTYQQYLRGYAGSVAARTGRLPTLKAVAAMPDFWRQVDIIMSGTKNKKPGSPLARALVEVGVRLPQFDGDVGTSPDSGVRVRAIRHGAVGKPRNTP